MFKGTTPTYTFTLPDTVDLSQAQKVYVTFSDRNETEVMTKTGEDIVVNANTVAVYLSQRDTLSLPDGQVVVQLNWLYQDGSRLKRACSEKKVITTEKNLINRMLTL